MDYKALEKILKEADVQKALQEYQKSLRRIDQNTQRAFQIIYYLNINIYLTTPKDSSFASIKQENCTDELWNTLSPLLTCDVPTAFRARLYDFGWFFYKKFECAQEAFNNYLTLLELLSPGHSLISCFCRCISIYQSVNNQKMKTELASIIPDLIQKYLQTGDSPYTILLLCYDNSLTCAEELLKVCNDVENNSNKLYEQYYKLKIKILNKTQLIDKKDQIATARRSLIDLYKRLASGSNIFGNIHCLKLAIKELRELPHTEQERQILNKELSALQATAITQMHSQRIPLDINEEMEALQKCIDTDNIQELIHVLFCMTNVPKYKEIKEIVVNDTKEYALSSLFPKILLDERGKTIAHLPPLDHSNPEKDADALHAHICSHLKERYIFTASIYINPVVQKIKSLPADHSMICKKIAENCFFIPQNRREAFAKGLAAGLTGDYITALSILVPQLENALRCLAEELGGIIYGMASDGTERVRTMDDIIKLPEITDNLDEDVLINIQALFLSRYGANLRNCVAHGMINDSDFHSAICVYAWAFIFRLCYMWQSYSQERLAFQEAMYEKINKIFREIEANI